MKSSFGKLRKLSLNKSEPKGNWDHHISAHTDGLIQAAKDMKDMRTCYDSLLSAAAATANSAYEFSESLLEMGNCLLEKTAMHDDSQSGRALSLLGTVQLELQKLVDCYRSHIIMTITNPSESLLSELRKVEEMKLQCDEKREMFEYMVGQFKEKGKSRPGKGEAFTSQQLQSVCEEYDEVARLCVFRVQSLKQGQYRSLLTQVARHHEAQINFFRKGLQSLEAVEPHIRNIAEKEHIDCELGELNNAEGEEEGNSFATNDEGELSFDYTLNKAELENINTSRTSMELDPLGAPTAQTSRMKDVEVQLNIGKNQGEQIIGQRRQVSSYSAPIYAEKFDPAERIREMKTSVQKLNTHVLPTPDDAKSSVTSSSTSLSSTVAPQGPSNNLWHSSPLDIEKQKKFLDDHSSAQSYSKMQTVAEGNSNNKHLLPLPRPLTEGPTVPQFEKQSSFDTQKMKRQAFSGPLAASKPSFNKSLLPASGPINSAELPQSVSGLLSRVSAPQPPASLNVSHNASQPPLSSPKINELHELPRPPDSSGSKTMHLVGHSAPLVNKNREVSPPNRNTSTTSKGMPRLPLPHLTVSRSFSIPSRAMTTHSGKLSESSETVHNGEDVASPTLTTLSLSNLKSPNSGRIRVDAGGS